MTQTLFGQTEGAGVAGRTIGRREHLTFRGNVSLGRHGWLRLTPAYSLHLVRALLDELGPEDRVLDPFSGTGTTPLACAAAGIRCDAVEINPFLVWLGRLKLTVFEPGTAEAVASAATRVAESAGSPGPESWRPDIHAIEKWWDASTLHALAAICGAIRHVEQGIDPRVVDLLRIAFCRVMIQSANVSFGHQSMSFRKRTAGGRLVCEDAEGRSRRLADAFLNSAKDVVDGLDEIVPGADCRVFLGDSRNLPAALPSGGPGYTGVITSPPYPNRMSYIRELRPYMYWLGFLTNGRAAGELDWQAIGGTWGCATSLLGAWTPDSDNAIPFPRFDAIVRRIGSRHPLLGRYVHRYFTDIKAHVFGLCRVLAPGAKCHYIVGNSKFYDVMLPVEEVYAALFKEVGFADVSVETIRKRSSKKELFEFIVHARWGG